VPNYCYICSNCGKRFEEFHKVGEHAQQCPGCGYFGIHRDYQTEFSGIGIDADGWESGGYNYGIAYQYKNKVDLLREIRARGFDPSLHGNGLKPVHRELYGDERRMLGKKKKDDYPQVIVED